MASDSLGGVGETSPKEGDNSITPELNHVQSNDLCPQSQNCTADGPSSTDAASSLAESVCIETASSSDSGSLDTEERKPHQSPHAKNGLSAHRWLLPPPPPTRSPGFILQRSSWPTSCIGHLTAPMSVPGFESSVLKPLVPSHHKFDA